MAFARSDGGEILNQPADAAVRPDRSFGFFYCDRSAGFYPWIGVDCSRHLSEPLLNVRFTPKSGHVQCNSACPLCANSGHQPRFEMTGVARRPTARVLAHCPFCSTRLFSDHLTSISPHRLRRVPPLLFSARGRLHHRRSTKRDRCGSPPTAIPLRSAENIVRRSVR